MLSQVRSLRHTIMMIVTIASLMGLAPYSALAAPMTYDFTFRVGTGNCNPVASLSLCLKGSFTGEDKNNDGFIDTETTEIELTNLMGEWIREEPGSPPVPGPVSFLFSITDFSNPPVAVEFQYQIVNNMITKLKIGDQITYPENPDPNSSCTEPGLCITIGLDDSVQLEVTGQDVVGAAAPGAAVPEPSTAILLSLGLVGMILYAFARRLRPTAPQRVPVADTTR